MPVGRKQKCILTTTEVEVRPDSTQRGVKEDQSSFLSLITKKKALYGDKKIVFSCFMRITVYLPRKSKAMDIVLFMRPW